MVSFGQHCGRGLFRCCNRMISSVPANMATGSDHSSLFSSITWTGQPVVFHRKAGRNIALSENNTVASSSDPDDDYAVVCTSEPVSIGQMFKVTVKRSARWMFGLSEGLVSTKAVCDVVDPKSHGNVSSWCTMSFMVVTWWCMNECAQVTGAKVTMSRGWLISWGLTILSHSSGFSW